MQPTSDVIKSIVELVRSGHYGDGLHFDFHMPDDKDQLKGHLTVACAIIDVLTSGPKQEEVLEEMLRLGAGITTAMPEPVGEPGREEWLAVARGTVELSWAGACVCAHFHDDGHEAGCKPEDCAVCSTLEVKATEAAPWLCPKTASCILAQADKDPDKDKP